MLDILLAALLEDGLDPLLGLTCEVPFVRISVTVGVCPVCGSRLDKSAEAVRSLKVACSAASCGFVLRARGLATAKSH